LQVQCVRARIHRPIATLCGVVCMENAPRRFVPKGQKRQHQLDVRSLFKAAKVDPAVPATSVESAPDSAASTQSDRATGSQPLPLPSDAAAATVASASQSDDVAVPAPPKPKPISCVAKIKAKQKAKQERLDRLRRGQQRVEGDAAQSICELHFRSFGKKYDTSIKPWKPDLTIDTRVVEDCFVESDPAVGTDSYVMTTLLAQRDFQQLFRTSFEQIREKIKGGEVLRIAVASDWGRRRSVVMANQLHNADWRNPLPEPKRGRFQFESNFVKRPQYDDYGRPLPPPDDHIKYLDLRTFVVHRDINVEPVPVRNIYKHWLAPPPPLPPDERPDSLY
jgi:hypothetical protein